VRRSEWRETQQRRCEGCASAPVARCGDRSLRATLVSECCSLVRMQLGAPLLPSPWRRASLRSEREEEEKGFTPAACALRWRSIVATVRLVVRTHAHPPPQLALHRPTVEGQALMTRNVCVRLERERGVWTTLLHVCCYPHPHTPALYACLATTEERLVVIIVAASAPCCC
jgi:hypothetical protein